MLVGVLAIFKAGGVYLPLDPQDPVERLEYLLRDADAAVVLTQASLEERLPALGVRVVQLDVDAQLIARHSLERLPGCVTGENLAYVIYTSGSTGQPKGVQLYARGTEEPGAGPGARLWSG